MSSPLRTRAALQPNADIERLVVVTSKLDNWMREAAWPLWWESNRHANGSYFEALDFNGRSIKCTKARVRVQARQIFSFAMAHTMGWNKPGLEEGIRQSLDRFMLTCVGPEGLPGTQVDIEEGLMRDASPSLYNVAFMLLALAQTREAICDPVIDGQIELLLDNLDRCMGYGLGLGYRETLPADNFRYQNPHMHLYEALLCLFRVTRDPQAGERAEQLLEFIRDTFFDERNGYVNEIAGAPRGETPEQFEPGHSMEWVWLLGLRSRLFGVPLDPFAIRLYWTYVRSGIAEGKTPMCLTLDYKPIDSTCRLWSQNEALKAHLCIYESGPPGLSDEALTRAADCAEYISNHWLNTSCAGGFVDQFDADGNILSADIPASMGYHIYLSIAELLRVTSSFR
jgi:mannose-6-phosphate isomerase